LDLLNYMEEAVKRSLEELLNEAAYQNLGLDEKAKLDVMAYCLNHLPPRYIVTEKGHLYSRVNELRQQFKTDIVVELSKAIEHIKANPR
jgi:competence protein ComFB